MAKVTLTLDDQTIHRLSATAERLQKPKSAVVREAIAEYHDRVGSLSERERQRLLRAFDELVPLIPVRPLAAVKKEIAQLRAARRRGRRGR